MKTTVNFYEFRNAFEKYGRGNQFTYNGLNAIFDYLTELEEEIGEELELDVIAICCDFTEYGDLEEIQGDYTNVESIEDLYNQTQVIEFNGGIIIKNY